VSHFVTPIPVDVDRIKKLLPPGSTFVRVEWNKDKSCVEMFWYNGQLQTKYSWSFPFQIAQLEAKEIPDGVTTPEQRESLRLGDEARKVGEEMERHRMAVAEAKAQEIDAIARAEALGLRSKVDTNKQNVLTATNVSATSQPSEKAPEIVAGLPVRQTPRDRTRGRAGANRPRPSVAGPGARHSASDKAKLDATGPGPNSGVSSGQHGSKTSDDA
jgi:hypothetical protein